VHFPSFDLRDPVFEAFGFAFSVQVVTLANVYGIDPERTRAHGEGGGFVVRASGLASAGQQERQPGSCELRVEPAPDGTLRVHLRAEAPEPIRCTKLVLRGLATPLEIVENGQARAASAMGEILSYPNRLPLPLLTLRCGGEPIAVRFEDPRVREKRFAVAIERIGERAGQGSLEIIHEEDASRFAREHEAPLCVIARGAAVAGMLDAQLAFARRGFGLRDWAEREDVPSWARGLRLALTLHGMHWTGRRFLDYAGMLRVIRFVAERIEGRRVLAYLPGWEGRYYWQYGDYRPEPRLGGDAGFAALCDGARALGVHLMPMFGGNCVNATLPRFRALDPRAVLKSATGNRFHGNQPDWDFARAHDTGWQAWLNPGHPGWRDDLATQIETLAARFGFDGAFLDTIHVWTNDADHPVYDGIRALVARLRERIPNLLLAAEHDYDALLAIFPLFQRAWWSRSPEWTARYALRMAHLCEGEPEGRTGVHEFGVWPQREKDPPWCAAPGFLPTLAFQDDTLERSREAIELAIAALADSRLAQARNSG
jgi:hypothetical protein